MFNIKIPQNRLRKLRTFGLGKKVFEFKNDKETNLIDLCSNDYFGLSRDKDIIKAAYETSLSQGLGSGSSRFISGTREVHQLLENELAEWLNQDKVLLFPSGYQANIAAVQALKKFPIVNASIDGSDVVYHGYQDIGVAVSTERGLVVPIIKDADPKSLPDAVDKMKNKLGSGVVVLASVQGGRIALIAGVTQDLTDRLDAGQIVNHVAQQVGGKGGGRKDLARAGGDQVDQLDGALESVIGFVEKALV